MLNKLHSHILENICKIAILIDEKIRAALEELADISLQLQKVDMTILCTHTTAPRLSGFWPSTLAYLLNFNFSFHNLTTKCK